MTSQSEILNRKSKITIVGAGPAGASLAIRLARADFEVTLIEREKFPREKLCGEFVSPECFAHFRELEVFKAMQNVGGDSISETIFYAPNGKNVRVSSEWFGSGAADALGISRAEMDFQLLEKAKIVGVRVLEQTQTVGLLFEDEKVCGVKVRTGANESKEISADLTIDATGRTSVLGKLIGRNSGGQIKNQKSKTKNLLVGFKAHLKNVNLQKNRCEIYFFRGGYGGLNFVENGLANHCFLIKAEIVKEFAGDANEIVENVIFQNTRARKTLQNAAPVDDWLAVTIDSFGAKNLNPAPNLFAVGDAAAFIDPFTGSGMLMALESAKILGETITENQFALEKIAAIYPARHAEKFRRRLLICSLMRRAAFAPALAKTLISALSYGEMPRRLLARSTRRTGFFAHR